MFSKFKDAIVSAISHFLLAWAKLLGKAFLTAGFFGAAWLISPLLDYWNYAMSNLPETVKGDLTLYVEFYERINHWAPMTELFLAIAVMWTFKIWVLVFRSIGRILEIAPG